jgi:DNA modification methylase
VNNLRLDHIEHADAISYLRTLPDGCVNCVVTSPPYFGLRDYGMAGQIGLEPTPGEYVAALVEVFREVRRVLRDDGVVWLNLGDSYAASGEKQTGRRDNGRKIGSGGPVPFTAGGEKHTSKVDTGLPPKSLMGIPWRVAFGLQDDGWMLRADIIWAKTACMPESVTDRPTRSHEYIFLLAKGPKYWYDAAAVSEPTLDVSLARAMRGTGGDNKNVDGAPGQNKHSVHQPRKHGEGYPINTTRNRRTVWTITPANYADAHFATFPEAIPEICIKAGCPEWCCDQCGAPWVAQVETVGTIKRRWSPNDTAKHGDNWRNDNGNDTQNVKEVTGYAPSCTCNAGKRAGVVLDPFSGAGTTALVAKKLNRRYLGCDLNADYVEMARRRVDGISYTLFSLMEVTGD